MSGSSLMVGLGELLWDILPSGKVLGGAPTNFAYMATMLGDQGIVASRVGADRLGREACELMESLGLNTSYLQHDNNQQTGTVGIVLHPGGQPGFTIHHPVAWDFMEWNPKWKELASRADVVCFGSLAQRSEISAGTIDHFLRSMQKSAVRICDVNLREPFYSMEVLCRSFEYANILKVNQEELLTISALLGFQSDDPKAIAHNLMTSFKIDLICITRGENGSLLVSDHECVEHRGFRIKVADSIGAGDAFTACVAHYYLNGASIEEISERANRIGSWIATQVGATPLIRPAKLQEILDGHVVN